MKTFDELFIIIVAGITIVVIFFKEDLSKGLYHTLMVILVLFLILDLIFVVYKKIKKRRRK